MPQQHSIDLAAIDAELDHIRPLGIVALRARWRSMFGVVPPAGLTKEIIARMIAFRLQEEAFGGLENEPIKVLERCSRGDRAGELTRRLKPGTVLIREYQGERHAVTVVPEGFQWRDTVYTSLSTIARAITGTAWNGPRFFGLRMARSGSAEGPREPKPVEPSHSIGRPSHRSSVMSRAGPSHRARAERK